MRKKARPKGRPAMSKLRVKGKSRSSKVNFKRKPTKQVRKTSRIKATLPKTVASSKKVVRIMGRGQFSVDGRTLKKLNDIDTSIVNLVSLERSNDTEFRKKLAELSELVVKNGKALNPNEIIKTDIILPSADLSIDEAKRLFTGEGVIPAV